MSADVSVDVPVRMSDGVVAKPRVGADNRERCACSERQCEQRAHGESPVEVRRAHGLPAPGAVGSAAEHKCVGAGVVVEAVGPRAGSEHVVYANPQGGRWAGGRSRTVVAPATASTTRERR